MIHIIVYILPELRGHEQCLQEGVEITSRALVDQAIVAINLHSNYNL